MKKLNGKFIAIIATLATFVATTVASSACAWYFYQPEEPKALREE